MFRTLYFQCRAADADVTEQIETHIGDLRTIDLDNISFILRKAGDVQEICCTFVETAREGLARLIQVTGNRQAENGCRAYATLPVTRLEVLDDQDSDTSNGREREGYFE